MDDQDVIIHSDANIDQVHVSLPESQRNGERIVKAAVGGIDDEFSEQSPLLASDPTRWHSRRPDPAEDYNQWAGLPWYKQPSVYWFLIPFIFSAIAFGGILVPKLSLITTLICREYYADKSLNGARNLFNVAASGGEILECGTPEVAASVSRFTMQGAIISGTLSAFSAPKLGALSDRYGRLKVMMITNAGALAGEIITIFAALAPDTFPVYWILVGYFIDGLCGSFTASMAISHAYAADCTPPKQRNVIFGYFHGMLFTGIAIGPLLAAKVIEKTGGVIAMFYIALGCHLAFILLLVFFIPESLSKARQTAARERFRLEQDADPAGDWITYMRRTTIFKPLRILSSAASRQSRDLKRNLLLLASIDTICFGVGIGAMSVVSIYIKYRFKLPDEEWSNFIGYISVARVICLLVILPLITRLVRGKPTSGSGGGSTSGADLFELSVIRFAIMFDVIGYLGYTLATSKYPFLASGLVASVGGVGSPTLQAALTKHVAPSRIGELLGAMALLHAVARVLAPVFFNSVFSATLLSKREKTVFVILTVLFSITWLLSWLLKPNVHLVTEDDDEDEDRSRQPTESRPPESAAELEPLLGHCGLKAFRHDVWNVIVRNETRIMLFTVEPHRAT